MNGSRVEGSSAMRGRRTRVFTRLDRCSVATRHPRGSSRRESRVPPRQVQRRRLQPRAPRREGGFGRAMQPREWAARCSLLAPFRRFQEEERNPEGPRSSLEEKEDDDDKEEEVEGGRYSLIFSRLFERFLRRRRESSRS